MIHKLNLRRSRYIELCVDIKERFLKDGRVRITATAISAEDVTEFENIASYVSKPVSLKRINSAIAEAIAVIESRYYDIYGEGELNEAAFCKAFDHVADDVNNGMHLMPDWDSASTNNDVIRFFRRNTLKLLIQVIVKTRLFLEEDRDALYTEMTKICARHGSRSELAAQENASKRLKQAEIVLSHMRLYDARIPDIKLTSPEFIARARRDEQVKMLPIHVLRRFYRLLYSYVATDPKKVFFAVLVIFNCRPAEASGAKPSDIEWYDDFCCARINHKEINWTLSNKLKNSYSKRRIIIAYWGMHLLKQCCVSIGEDYPKDDKAMNNSVECAAWVKHLLIESGATEAQLKEISSDITNDDMDDSSVYDPKRTEDTARDKSAKIGCYVLRRCATTIMRVNMGLTLYETDRLLGHIPHGSGRNKANKLSNPDLNSPEVQRKIAAKMERFVYDLDYSRHPKYAPITTDGREAIPLMTGYAEVCIENNEKTGFWADIDMEAFEMGDSLAVIFPPSSDNQFFSSSVPISYENIDRTIFVETPEEKDGE